MKKIHAIGVSPELVDSEDLREQLENKERVPIREMTVEAQSVLSKCWSKELDGCVWPPPGDSIAICFVR